MARLNRVDRGLLTRMNRAGKPIWYVRLYHDGREQQFGSFPNKTMAREFYEKAKLEQKAGQFFPERFRKSGSELVTKTLDRYIETISGKKPATVASEKYYSKWWKDRLKGKRLNGITPGILEEAIRDLKADDLAPQTIVHYMKFLRHVLYVAKRDGKLEENPFTKIKLPIIRPGRTRFLTVSEETKLLEALGPRHGPWARFAILTGLRKSEQFGLRWADVDPERGLITLPTSKTGGVQYVHLNEEAKGILQSWIADSKSIWVFPSENKDTHLNVHNFYGRVFLPTVREAKLEDVTWHTLRHTFASRLAMNGQTESTIAALLRHSGTGLVARYAHLSPSHLQTAVEGLAGFGKVPDNESPETRTQTRTPKETQDTLESKPEEVTEKQEENGRGERIRFPGPGYASPSTGRFAAG